MISYPTFLIRKFKGIRVAVNRRWREKRISGVEIGEQVKIYDLVCPLRYDILVRANFIALLAENDALSASDLGNLLEYPAVRAYQTWLKEVEVRRFFPEIYHDENRIRERFYERVQNVQKLWKSMCSRGFDYSHPIKLKSGKLVREVNGKTVGASIFAGDGCHRIACLLVMGKSVLEPNEYEVTLSAELQPIDNTKILLEKLPISMSDYLSFISCGYCGGRPIVNADEILAYVEEHSPHRLAELKIILQHDIIHKE